MAHISYQVGFLFIRQLELQHEIEEFNRIFEGQQTAIMQIRGAILDASQRESLYCIRCGACQNVCPVYKNIGDQSYGTTYTGPIGSVISPHLNSQQDYKHLSYASSLCGACTEICPVNINIHGLLQTNRKESVEQGLTTFSERMAWKIWKVASLKRGLMNKGKGKMKSAIVNALFRDWNKHHSPLQFSPKTFNELWKDRQKLK